MLELLFWVLILWLAGLFVFVAALEAATRGDVFGRRREEEQLRRMGRDPLTGKKVKHNENGTPHV